jgi:hypothetical protein
MVTKSTTTHELSLSDKIKRCMEEYKNREPKYKRKEARILIGFTGSTKSFGEWLRNNHFLQCQDYPESTLIDRGILDVHVKEIYPKVVYDCCNNVISGNENATVFKHIYTPLFTLKGIEYFKELLKNEAMLKEEVNQIILSNKPHN